jgi:hypothetical protein
LTLTRAVEPRTIVAVGLHLEERHDETPSIHYGFCHVSGTK